MRQAFSFILLWSVNFLQDLMALAILEIKDDGFLMQRSSDDRGSFFCFVDFCHVSGSGHLIWFGNLSLVRILTLLAVGPVSLSWSNGARMIASEYSMACDHAPAIRSVSSKSVGPVVYLRQGVRSPCALIGPHWVCQCHVSGSGLKSLQVCHKEEDQRLV